MPERVLIVDDDAAARHLMRDVVRLLGHEVTVTATGRDGLDAAARDSPALVFLDIDLPDMSGFEVLRQLTRDENRQVVMVTGHHELETVRRSLREGAYDYLLKPFEIPDFGATVDRALERHRLVRQNREYRRDLERRVAEQTEAIRETRDIALLTLARLAESRDNETGRHFERIAAFSRRLGEELRQSEYAAEVTEEFLDTLYRSSPLHDIGKVGIPDAVLLKPGPLSPEEWLVMQRHPTIGGDTLRRVCERYAESSFLTMGMDIAYAHHERWNGTGYPRGLAGGAIPLAARIVGLADVYDAITTVRPYKPALSHDEAVHRVEHRRGQHFDPVLVDAFLACHDDFARIGDAMSDERLDEPSWREHAAGA